MSNLSVPLFLATHISAADKQMVVHNLECPVHLKVFTHIPDYNNCCYYVFRKGKELTAYVTVNFINSYKELLLVVIYGLCDGSEGYSYDSRNHTII